MIGVDYASVDGNRPPDLEKAKAAGLSFAIIRGAYGKTPDPHYKRDWAALAEAGIVRSAYLFLRFDVEGGPAQEQAEAFCKYVTLEAGKDFPPILDVEFPRGRVGYNLSIATALHSIREAWATLRDHYGVIPGIYTSARVWAEDLGNVAAPDLGESPAWLAKPWPWAVRTRAQLGGATEYAPNVPPPWGDQYFLYQYQGDATGFPGFSATVDINRFNTLGKGSYGDAVRWVQRQLRYQGGQPGLYDDAVRALVVTFQHEHGLIADGVVGPKTFAMLCWYGAAPRGIIATQ